MAGGPMLSGYTNEHDNGSPPLNLAERLYLDPLDEDALRALLSPLAENAALTLASLEQYAGAHPWLAQVLCREMFDHASVTKARREAHRMCHHSFIVWQRQLGERGVELLSRLPDEGVDEGAFLDDASWIPFHDAYIRAAYMYLVKVRKDRVLPGSTLFNNWLKHNHAAPAQAWDLAISYASEDRELARAIYAGLQPSYRVFLDVEETPWLWAKDGYKVLPKLFRQETRYVLVISTKHYINKHWTLIEFEAACADDSLGEVLILKMDVLPRDLPESVERKGVIHVEGSPANLVKLLDTLRERLRSSDRA